MAVAASFLLSGHRHFYYAFRISTSVIVVFCTPPVPTALSHLDLAQATRIQAFSSACHWCNSKRLTRPKSHQQYASLSNMPFLSLNVIEGDLR
jgi:hypothetical protein